MVVPSAKTGWTWAGDIADQVDFSKASKRRKDHRSQNSVIVILFTGNCAMYFHAAVPENQTHISYFETQPNGFLLFSFKTSLKNGGLVSKGEVFLWDSF